MPRLLCFMPAPQQNTPPHNKTPNLQRPQPTDARRHDVPTNPTPSDPQTAQTRQPVYVEVTPQKEVAVTTVVAAMALYACLRHALSGCHETPRPSLPLLSRGIPSKRVPPAHSLAPRLLAWARQCHGAAMHLTQNTFTTYHSTSTSDIYTRYGVIRVPLARFWGVTRTHDRHCRSSVVGYQVNVYLRHTPPFPYS